MTSRSAAASATPPAGQRAWRLSSWRVRLIGLAVIAVVLLISYFALAAFVPRWWAQRIGDQIGGSLIKGTWLGLLYGGVCTLLPLVLLVAAIVVWRKIGSHTKLHTRAMISGIIVLIGLACSAPNLMTLGIATGDGNGAHAGQRILDVEGPGFRNGSLFGAIGAILLFLVVNVALVLFRRRRRARKAAAAS